MFFYKLCIIFRIYTSPVTSSHSALFGSIRTFEFDESKITGACVKFEPRALENQPDMYSTLKLGCWLNIINPPSNQALVTTLKGDDWSVRGGLRSNLRKGDFLPVVNTAASRIEVKLYSAKRPF